MVEEFSRVKHLSLNHLCKIGLKRMQPFRGVGKKQGEGRTPNKHYLAVCAFQMMKAGIGRNVRVGMLLCMCDFRFSDVTCTDTKKLSCNH
jgi:hypothetical protein